MTFNLIDVFFKKKGDKSKIRTEVKSFIDGIYKKNHKITVQTSNTSYLSFSIKDGDIFPRIFALYNYENKKYSLGEIFLNENINLKLNSDEFQYLIDLFLPIIRPSENEKLLQIGNYYNK